MYKLIPRWESSVMGFLEKVLFPIERSDNGIVKIYDVDTKEEIIKRGELAAAEL